jgi:hypothetical protein
VAQTRRMARRADPARIFITRRSAVRNRLVSEGMAEETAEAWVDEWQDEADRQGLERSSADYLGRRRLDRGATAES